MPKLVLSGYIMVLALLLFTRWTNKHKIGLICKAILGMIFLSFSLIMLMIKRFCDTADLMIIYSLLCNCIGDIFLGICKVDKKNINLYFYFAVVIIAISQVIFLSVSVILSKYNVITMLLSAAIVFLLYINCNKIPNMGNKPKAILAYAYILNLAMLNSAINIFDYTNIKVLIFGVGMIIYWISDLFLLIIKFINNNRVLDLINKILYYLAQIIIAYCIIW